MALLSKTQSFIHQLPIDAATLPADDGRPGRYLTDGVTLYRLLRGPNTERAHDLIAIEDCRSLEIMLVERHDLRCMRRVVAAKGAAAEDLAAETAG